MNQKYFDFSLIKVLKLYCQVNVFKKAEQKELVDIVKKLDEEKLRQILIDKLPAFEKKLKNIAKKEPGSDYIIEGIKESLLKLNEQLSLFGEN